MDNSNKSIKENCDYSSSSDQEEMSVIRKGRHSGCSESVQIYPRVSEGSPLLIKERIQKGMTEKRLRESMSLSMK
jgi:hypothetical protein